MILWICELIYGGFNFFLLLVIVNWNFLNDIIGSKRKVTSDVLVL